jgi:hypothetical protein
VDGSKLLLSGESEKILTDSPLAGTTVHYQ